MELLVLKACSSWSWMKPGSGWKCSTDSALELSSLSDWAMWNFGLIQTLMNWASKLVAMAFALSAVEEIELKRRVALVGCQEILLILSVVDWTYSSLKWHTKAVAACLHFPCCSRLMTECSFVRWPLQSPTAWRFLRFLGAFFNLLNRFASAVVGELFVAAFETGICYSARHIIYFVSPHWLYFKPHFVIWLSVCLMER